MRETILINALKEIKANSGNDSYIQEMTTKALTDWASAPKEGLQWVKEKISEQIAYLESIDLVAYDRGGLAQLKSVIEIINQSPSSAPESGQKEGLKWVKASERLPKIDNKNPKHYVFYNDFTNTSTSIWTQYIKEFPPFIMNCIKEWKWLDGTPAPESGGEEKPVGIFPLDNDEVFEYLRSNNDFVPNKSTPSTSSNSIEQEAKKYANAPHYSNGGKYSASPIMYLEKGFIAGAKFVLNKGNSDVKPVASHSVYDNNSTQLKKILVFAPADGKPHIAKITVNENDSTIEWIEPTSSEQEDKRSVATKSNQGGDAGNQTSLSKEGSYINVYVTNKQKDFLELIIHTDAANSIGDKEDELGNAFQWCIDACMKIEERYKEYGIDACYIGFHGTPIEEKQLEEIKNLKQKT